MVFTNEEMVDMLLIYGEYFRNAKQTEQRYAERFPEIRHPTRPTFTYIVSRLRETGSLSPRKRIRNKTVTNEAAEVVVLAAVAINPYAISREMRRERDWNQSHKRAAHSSLASVPSIAHLSTSSTWRQ